MSLDARSLAWLRDHHATISSAVLGAHGIDPDARRRLVASGMLDRVVDGGYRFTGVDDDEWSRCAALCASRPHLVVGGPTAGRLWDLRRSPRDGLVHVIAPPRSNPCGASWVRVFRTATLPDADVVQRPDGIRVTSPPRTVVDMTRYIDDTALASMIEHALARQLCTTLTLQRVAERLGTRRAPVGAAVPPDPRRPDSGRARRVGVGASRVRRADGARGSWPRPPARGSPSRLRASTVRHGDP